MNLINTVPANRQLDIGIYSFGAMPNQNPSSVHLTIKHASILAGIYMSGSTTLQSLSLPNLVTIDPVDAQAGSLSIQGCTAMTSLSTPALMTVAGDLILVTSHVVSFSFPLLQACNLLAIGDSTFISSMNFPNLTDIDQLQPVGGAALPVFSLPALQTIRGLAFNQGIVCSGNFAGTTLDFPSLVTINGNTTAVGFCANLTTINLPAWLPTNSVSYFFSPNNPLSSATTNAMLARGVANAGYHTGTLQISGTPTGQGITDKATLQGRGVSVTTN